LAVFTVNVGNVGDGVCDALVVSQEVQDIAHQFVGVLFVNQASLAKVGPAPVLSRWSRVRVVAVGLVAFVGSVGFWR
jgi:hypothetical protein